MSLIHTIALHDHGRLHKTPIGKGSPRVNLANSSISPKDPINSKGLSQNRIQEHASTSQQENIDSNLHIDPFLAQYIKPVKFECSLNNHDLFFSSINKERKVDSINIYQKYLKNNNLHLDFNHKGLKNDRLKEIEEKIPVNDIRDSSNVSSEEKAIKRIVSPSKSPLDTKDSITRSLPNNFMECVIDDLVNLISRMLDSLISLNDKSVPESISNPRLSTSANSNNRLLTRYHSRVPPSISVRTYLTRLTKFNNLSPITLLTTIYYIDLLSHHYQPFFTLNSWTVHRFLLISTMISQKSMEDFFYTNDHYAKVGGVALSELNCLEVDFLYRVEWKCIPAKQLECGKSSIRYAKDVLDLYYSQLIKLMGNNVSKGDKLTYVASLSTVGVGITIDGDDEIANDENDADSINDYDEEDYDEVSIGSVKMDSEKSVNMDINQNKYDEKSVNMDVNQNRYDEKGFSIDRSSSPHLKRKYYEA